MEKKQTAVDWLIKEFNLESYKATIALVKEMEKEQQGYSEEEVRLMLSESFKASKEGYHITSDEIINNLKKIKLCK